MLEIVEKIFSQFGFGVGMAIVFILFAYYILNWLRQSQDKREQLLIDIIGSQQKALDEHKKAIEEHTIQSREFHAAMLKANDYQREEHSEIIKMIARLNGGLK